MGQYVKYVKITEVEYHQVIKRLQQYTVGQYEGVAVKAPIVPVIAAETEVGFQEDETGDIMVSPFDIIENGENLI